MKKKLQVIKVPIYPSSGRDTRNPTSATFIAISYLLLLMRSWLKFPRADNITNNINMRIFSNTCLHSTILVLCYFFPLSYILTVQIEKRNENTSGDLFISILLNSNSIHEGCKRLCIRAGSYLGQISAFFPTSHC